MCEADAYLLVGGNHELLLQCVDKITPNGEELVLENIFGQRKIIRGRIVEMALVEHKIILEKNES